ncbi:hypothetical protein [Ferruginibacter sp. SUN106]|uniref:hypothetical protein n=1 Tax=Ferruginibacter sp. SUN106 TaxID=2978348 RepID=UPI003D35F1A7
MQKTEDFILNRLKWKADKFGLPTEFAFYFNDLSSETKNHLVSQIDKANSGTPVLYFTKPTNEWTLVCSRQVICCDNTKLVSLSISDIKRILPTAFDITLIGQPIDIKTVKKKSEWDTIKIIDKQDESNIFYANKGEDLFALWNILLMAKQLYE